MVEVEGIGIDTVGSAYALRVDELRVDAHRFDDLVQRARAAMSAEQPREAVRALSTAFDLWSGPALADVRDDPALGVEAAALDARRADAEDELARALVESGELKAAIELLERLVVAEPLREQRWGQLMVALHHDGRQTDALRGLPAGCERAGRGGGPRARP